MYNKYKVGAINYACEVKLMIKIWVHANGGEQMADEKDMDVNAWNRIGKPLGTQVQGGQWKI